MSDRFLKFHPTDEAFWLMEKKPNAFRLLSHIANTARRYEGHPDGLGIGECHLEHWKKYGFTERQYRTAKEILCKLNFIKIIETNRTRKKSTSKTTTNSTLVKLLDSRIWDINPENNDDQNDDRATTERRPNDDKLRKIRKKKKEEEYKEPLTPSSEKIKFREHVELTQVEFDSLVEKNGKEFLESMLDVLDSYKGSSGKKYKSDFHTMKDGGWVSDRVKKESLMNKNINSVQCNVNQQMGKNLEAKYFNFHKGWRCSEYRDSKKDQQGILFENQSPYVNPIFIAYSNGRFKEEVTNFLITKNMELV